MKKIAILSVLFFMVTCLPAQNLQQKMDSLVSAYYKSGKFNGSVLVAQKGNILFQKGYGYSNAATRQLNDAQSIYQIGSITKQFTSAIIMKLQEEKKLSVQDRLSKYFPGFANGDKITIEHLLTHTSGLYNYTNDSTIMNNDVTRHYTAQQMIEKFKTYPPDFPPGTQWNYSNSGYSMLGYIIEKVTGKPYERVVREYILNPLGMQHSGFDFTNLADVHKTKGYFILMGDSIKPAPIVDSTLAFSAGALYSTVGDLYKWERSITTSKLLKPASWNVIFTPFQHKYGYGWGIDSLYGKRITAHSGGIHGYASYIIRFPEEELVVIMIDNASHGPAKIARELAAIALNQPDTKPAVPKEITVDQKILRTYVGEYELQPGFTITISLDGKQLKGQATGQPAFDLFAEKENLFYLKVVDAKIEFVRNEKGAITDLILYQNGAAPKGRKIK
jgi:CubicO group peptidase (beta-lactamase class C family)